MKKLFVSVPMRWRTEDSIRADIFKLHKIAEAMFEEKLEVIGSLYEFREDPIGARESVWYLGKAIQCMSDADYFIGVDCLGDIWRGCNIEKNVAREYDIPMVLVDPGFLGDDIFNVRDTMLAVEKRVGPL